MLSFLKRFKDIGEPRPTHPHVIVLKRGSMNARFTQPVLLTADGTLSQEWEGLFAALTAEYREPAVLSWNAAPSPGHDVVFVLAEEKESLPSLEVVRSFARPGAYVAVTRGFAWLEENTRYRGASLFESLRKDYLDAAIPVFLVEHDSGAHLPLTILHFEG